VIERPQCAVLDALEVMIDADERREGLGEAAVIGEK
jgi:hypothetical protein